MKGDSHGQEKTDAAEKGYADAEDAEKGLLMEQVRCPKCRKLLFEIKDTFVKQFCGIIRIKCSRCNHLTTI